MVWIILCMHLEVIQEETACLGPLMIDVHEKCKPEGLYMRFFGYKKMNLKDKS